MALTCDFDSDVTPSEAASFSTRRVETPSSELAATTEATARSARRALLQELRVARAGPQLGDRQLDGPGPGVPLPLPVAVAAVHPLRGHLPVAGVAADLDIGVHHPLREPLDHLPEHIRARRSERLLEPRAGNRHNVTCGHFVLLRLVVSTSKDHEVAVSGHADTPSNRRTSHSRISYPIHHSRGRERSPKVWLASDRPFSGVRVDQVLVYYQR